MNKQDKDPMTWDVIDSEYLFKRPWLTARRDHVNCLLVRRFMTFTCWSIQSSAM